MASTISVQTGLGAAVEDELNKARDSLRRLDEDIRLLTGRNSDEFGHRFGKGRGGVGGRYSTDAPPRYDGGESEQGSRFAARSEAGRLGAVEVGQKRRMTSHDESGQGGFEDGWKRPRIASEYSRATRFVSDALDNGAPASKPAVLSTVTMPLKEIKSREEAITELKGNEAREVSARNRRMFGVLLGTLKKFKKDEEKQNFKDQERKQKEIETRLEEAKRKERMQMEKQRQKLLEKRRRQEQDIRRLQRKRALIAATENQVSLLKKLQNFIQTNTKPSIFFMPAKHTIRTIELQKKSQKKLEEMIKSKQDEAEEQLKQMDDMLVVGTADDDDDEPETMSERDLSGSVGGTKAEPVQEQEQDAVASSAVTNEGEGQAVGANDEAEVLRDNTATNGGSDGEPSAAHQEPPKPKDIQEELKELTAGYAEELNFEDDEQQR